MSTPVTDALLRPMPADGLSPRPAPQASAGAGEAALAPLPDLPSPSLMRPAQFSPAAQEEKDTLGELLDSFFADDEDDEGDELPDAVPTESMPVPACVPLYELSLPKRKRGFGKKG